MNMRSDGYVVAGIVALVCLSIGSTSPWGAYVSAFYAAGLLAYLLLHEG